MKTMIVDMSKKVLEHLAKKHSNVRKGVGDIMGGEILEYPSKTAWRQATEEGRKKGLQEGKREQLVELVQKKLAKNHSVEQIADALEESEDAIRKIIEELNSV